MEIENWKFEIWEVAGDMDYLKNRIKAALEIIQEGHSFNIDNLLFSYDNSGEVNITGFSQLIYLHSITKEGALDEVQKIKESFYEMVRQSPELQNFIKNKGIQFNLNLDIGKASILICSERGDLITWY